MMKSDKFLISHRYSTKRETYRDVENRSITAHESTETKDLSCLYLQRLLATYLNIMIK